MPNYIDKDGNIIPLFFKGQQGDKGEKGDKGEDGNVLQQEAIDRISSSLEEIKNKTNNVINTLQFPRLIGENDDSFRIKRALVILNNGGTLNSYEDLLINDEIIVPPNVNVDFCGVVTSSVVPTSIFKLNSNTSIKCNIEINTNLVDTSTKGRGIEILTNAKNVKIHDCNIKGCYWGVCSVSSNLEQIEIINNKFECIRQDIYLNGIVGSDLYIRNNISLGDKTHALPLSSMGEIFVCCGYTFENSITNTIYQNNVFKNIFIESNVINRSNHRPIFITNGRNVNIVNNNIGGIIGNKTTLGCSDDCIIVDLCDGFKIDGNYVEASGENGIDILSSINGVVCNNRINKCDDYGIVFDISDRFVEGKATLNDDYLIPRNVKVNGNTFEGKELAIGISLGRKIYFNGNDVKTFGSGTNGYFYTLDNPIITQWIKDVPTRKMGYITFSGTTQDDKDKSGIWQNNRDLVEQGTVTLEPNFGVNGIITLNANEQKAFLHNGGLYHNCRVEVQVNGVWHETKLYYADGSNFRGILPYEYDQYQVIVKGGNFLTDRQIGSLSSVTSASVRLTCY